MDEFLSKLTDDQLIAIWNHVLDQIRQGAIYKNADQLLWDEMVRRNIPNLIG